MPTSVGTKAKKKQSSSAQRREIKDAGLSASDTQFEYSLLHLENACLRVLDSQFADSRQDTQGLYWQQRFINIANPVSLALMEYKGPRHFHYHYRHREDDDSILHPVLENPVDMLAQVCEEALAQCQNELVGIEDAAITEVRDTFESALTTFLSSYRHYRSNVDDEQA